METALTTVKQLVEFSADNKIEISGIDNIPALAISEIITSNPFDSKDDDLYVAERKYITMSKNKNGKITHHRQVSDQFRVVPYEHSVFTVLEYVIGNMPEFGMPTVGLKFANDGGCMYATMKFDQIVLNVGTSKIPDTITPIIQIRDAIDLSGKYTGQVGGVRHACTNGMIIAHPDFQIDMFKMTHKTRAYDLGSVLDKIHIAFTNISKATDLWKNYIKTKISTLQLATVLEETGLSLRAQEKVLQLPLLGGKLATPLIDRVSKGHVRTWDAYNALTQYATHEISNPKVEFELGFSASKAIDDVLGLTDKSIV